MRRYCAFLAVVLALACVGCAQTRSSAMAARAQWLHEALILEAKQASDADRERLLPLIEQAGILADECAINDATLQLLTAGDRSINLGLTITPPALPAHPSPPTQYEQYNDGERDRRPIIDRAAEALRDLNGGGSDD